MRRTATIHDPRVGRRGGGLAIGTDMDASYQPVVTSHRQLPDLAAGLLERALGETEVGAVLGGNLVRLFRPGASLRRKATRLPRRGGPITAT